MIRIILEKGKLVKDKSTKGVTNLSYIKYHIHSLQIVFYSGFLGNSLGYPALRSNFVSVTKYLKPHCR